MATEMNIDNAKAAECKMFLNCSADFSRCSEGETALLKAVQVEKILDATRRMGTDQSVRMDVLQREVAVHNYAIKRRQADVCERTEIHHVNERNHFASSSLS